jgi:hypothetical protein
MNNSSDNVSINDILADVLVSVNDTEYKNGLGKGWYIRQIANAIEELAKDTYFQVLTTDTEFPENYRLSLPSNCFNVREIYLYDGVCGQPEASRPVYWKRHFNNFGGGTNYTARRKETMETDPYLTNGGESDLYYCNIDNGVIMFGSTCSAYSYVRIVYNGMGGDIGVEPIIPRVFRRAVIDFVKVEALSVFVTRDKSLMGLLQVSMLARDGSRGKPGSWDKAKSMSRRMSTWQRDNMKEYMSKGNY